jgi:DNA helicase-2/ATP-dependent DNA helicase PcrA
VTFTNKAAREMRERVEALVPDRSRDIQVSTFHAFGLRLLFRNDSSLHEVNLRPNFAVLDRAECKALIKAAMETLGVNSKDLDPSTVLEAVSRGKSQWSPTFQDLGLEGIYQNIYALYERQLEEQNAVDFDDLLLLPLKLMAKDKEVHARESARLEWILVDEYQDVNRPQYQLLKYLMGDRNRIVVVGDPDQSIYGWRGADMSMIMNFERDFAGAKVVVLDQNYRSTKNILTAANALIRSNSGRREKNLWTARGSGEKIYTLLAQNEGQEATFIASEIVRLNRSPGYKWGDMALLYRINAMSRIYEQRLIEHGIPYRIVRGTAFYERKEVKDVLAFMRLVINPLDRNAFLRTVNLPARGIGKASAEKLLNWMTELFPSEDAEGETDRSAVSFWGRLQKVKPPVAGRGAVGFSSFARHMELLAKRAENISEVFQYILVPMGYEDCLREQNPDDWEERLDNIRELRSLVPSEGSLAEALAEAALFTDMESGEAGDSDCINLMTLHAAKGLEFPVVFVAGMEESVFPHLRALDDALQMEEERRLCYVGFTRAEERLFLTAARSRRLFGVTTNQGFSRFLYEIPDQIKEIDDRGEERHVDYRSHRRSVRW